MLKSSDNTKRKTKTVHLCKETPHAVAPFVLAGVASEIIVSISGKVNTSCIVISHGRALFSCKRNSRVQIDQSEH